MTMKSTIVLLVVTLSNAIAVYRAREEMERRAMPATTFERIPLPSVAPKVVNYISTNNNIAVTTPLALQVLAAATATDSISSTEVASAVPSSCTPVSVCIDKMMVCPDLTRKRYGGCYDKNFCGGNTTPYPIPTCS